LEEANCILCSRPGEPQFQKSDKFSPYEKFRIVRCPACGLTWVSPRPSQNEIARYYPETYSWKPETEGERGLVRRAEWWYRFHLLRFETWGLLRHTDLKPGDAVLDVGCSSGDRLLAMRRAGLGPVGVEVSPMADYARERLGLDVRRGTLEQAEFEADRFQAVTLHNALEHVHDPRALLREVHRVLTPGGWLVVQVPNANSCQAALFGRRWAAIDVPRDLYYYTPDLLKKLLESERFEVETIVHRTSLLHPPTAASSLLPWVDPQRFWAVEAGGSRLKALAARMVWAGLTLAVAPAVWVESAAGKSAIPTTFARKRPDHAADSEGRGAPVGGHH